MPGLYCQASLELAFQLWLDELILPLGDWQLRLYGNAYTPVVTSVPSDFTELVAAGYAAIPEPIVNWTISTTATGAQAVMMTAFWTFLGAATIYGYYLDDAGSAILLGAEEFTGGPITFGSGGGTLTLDVTLILDTP